MRPCARLGVKLHRKCTESRIIHALAGAVIGVDKAQTTRLYRVRLYCIAVILACNIRARSVQALYRLIYSAVTVF